MKLHGERRRGVVPFALVGPVFSFLIDATQRIELAGVSVEEDVRNELAPGDFGFAFGGGVDLVEDWGAITFDARYTVGLVNIDDSGEGEVKASNLLVMGGVIF